MTENELKWHRRFLELCLKIAEWSKDRSTKTGCLIVKDHQILTTGFNGFPPGVDDSIEERHQRPQKYLYTEHCDRNAIYQAAKLGVPVQGADMYLSGPPCHDCSRGIVMAGLKQVIWPEDNPFEKDSATQSRWADSMNASFTILSEAGVNTVRIHL